MEAPVILITEVVSVTEITKCPCLPHSKLLVRSLTTAILYVVFCHLQLLFCFGASAKVLHFQGDLWKGLLTRQDSDNHRIRELNCVSITGTSGKTGFQHSKNNTGWDELRRRILVFMPLV